MTPPVDPGLVARILESVRTDLQPVRPIASANALVARLLAVFALLAIAGATLAGFSGLRQLDPGAAFLILAQVSSFALLTAAASANAVVPGSRQPFHPAKLAAGVCLLLAAIFALVFHDYTLGRFVPQGIACFRLGAACAIVAAVAARLVLRRGFAVDPRAASIATGTFAGLAGLAMLELHCPNFRLPHVAVWHLGVVAAGAGIGYFFGSNRSDAELMQ